MHGRVTRREILEGATRDPVFGVAKLCARTKGRLFGDKDHSEDETTITFLPDKGGTRADATGGPRVLRHRCHHPHSSPPCSRRFPPVARDGLTRLLSRPPL